MDGQYESDNSHNTVDDRGRGNYGVISEAISKKNCGTHDVPIYEDEETLTGYIALSGNANIWDVTDVKSANDDVAMGSFKKDIDVYTVLVIENNAIRTAWIWDVPGSSDRPTQPQNPYVVLTDNYRFVFVNCEGLRAGELEDLLKAELSTQGYVVEEVTNDGHDILTAKVVRNGVKNTFYAGGFASVGTVAPSSFSRPAVGGNVTIIPAAVDVPDKTGHLEDLNPNMANISNVPGHKMTVIDVELPLDSAYYCAVVQTNSALQSCAVNSDGTSPWTKTAEKVGNDYVQAGVLVTSDGSGGFNKLSSFSMSLLVCDDGRPVTLDVYADTRVGGEGILGDPAEGTPYNFATLYGNDNQPVDLSTLTKLYTVTIDTSCIVFD